ncbi:hypothetical protein [Simiduia agarivorans]|uniref:Uncharacterized protein n=1 Tax=Simiduia agarivorans (strain DSM 21679 / JCM 13881 / BCRC 17597 / SA1) TaxID=1117647 RepID=K4KJV9_SIMAS|nr:hypothetical protein [Simiduia agarivorans]AFU98515.1 hypothetical protein M5M_06600 [Simiduia agarivorans SA1 = DSM 21679]
MEPVYSKDTVDKAIRDMEVQAVNFGYRFIGDAKVRQAYMRQTKQFSRELIASVESGAITPKQAATTANQMRNELMEFARVRSSDIGRAKAKALKARGLNLDDLMNKYANSLFKKPFRLLNGAEKDRVFIEIVESAGRARPKVNAQAARLGVAGKALWVLAAGIAIYNISVADNKWKATGREAANLGGGFAGGAAGGALAGIWFGPVGVAVGVVIGGVIGAISADQVYVEIAGPDGEFAKQFIPRFTNLVSTDESGMASALVTECSYELDKVLAVFQQLNDKYHTDADDIALLYTNKVRSLSIGSPLSVAFRAHGALRRYLAELMDAGWTTQEEKDCVNYLRSFG